MVATALAALALACLSAGCNRVRIVEQDSNRAAWVDTVTILPFAGVEVKNYLAKGDDEDAKEWNEQATKDYGGFPKRFAEAVAAATGARASFGDKEPAKGFYVKGLFERAAPGSAGLRIGAMFTPGGGNVAMAEEGKVEVRFTCWLKEVGKEKETPIATLSGQHENTGTWFGGYDAMWDLADLLARHLGERLKQVAPNLAK
jgi:hypothetical protein